MDARLMKPLACPSCCIALERECSDNQTKTSRSELAIAQYAERDFLVARVLTTAAVEVRLRPCAGAVRYGRVRKEWGAPSSSRGDKNKTGLLGSSWVHFF